MEQLADFPQTERSEQTSNHDGALAAYRLHWRIGTAHIVRINAYVAGAYSSLSHGGRKLSSVVRLHLARNRTKAKPELKASGPETDRVQERVFRWHL